MNNQVETSRVDVLAGGQIQRVTGGRDHSRMGLSGIIFSRCPKAVLGSSTASPPRPLRTWRGFLPRSPPEFVGAWWPGLGGGPPWGRGGSLFWLVSGRDLPPPHVVLTWCGCVSGPVAGGWFSRPW